MLITSPYPPLLWLILQQRIWFEEQSFNCPFSYHDFSRDFLMIFSGLGDDFFRYF